MSDFCHYVLIRCALQHEYTMPINGYTMSINGYTMPINGHYRHPIE
jgi:hypothetical protein